jgi:hypothetical protein
LEIFGLHFRLAFTGQETCATRVIGASVSLWSNLRSPGSPGFRVKLGPEFPIENRDFPASVPGMYPKAFSALRLAGLLSSLGLFAASFAFAAETTIKVATPMAAPEWAKLERRLLAETVPAAREFTQKYYDDRGYFQYVVRWGANDGPDDALENFAGWPEFHALGASDEIRDLHLRTWNGMLRQFTEAKTVEVPAGRQGMYYKDFSVQSDWMHHGEALRSFNTMSLSMAQLPIYHQRVKTFAAMYMGEDPEAPNYDPQHKIIRSMMNGSRGPMLRKATSIDWVGDPFDVSKFVALHGENTFEQFLAHYREYTDVVGDHFLNLVATTLPLNGYLLTGEAKYKQWLTGYMDAWLDRMKQNNGIIPSYIALDGKIGGPENKWWGNAYGWGFSPVNPVTGKREDRTRIPRALVGFANALLVTGDQRYVDAWRNMIEVVNSHARTANGKKEYPSMYGAGGWYGWQNKPWDIGALEVWYWSMKSEDRPRVGRNAWVEFLEGKNPSFPETALRKDVDAIPKRLEKMRKDPLTPETRLADNAMEFNPVEPGTLLQLMWGAIPPGREGSVLASARLRYFDPARNRAGIPEDVGALVSELTADRTTVTLVNLSTTATRTVTVQGGGYGEHQILSVDVGGKTTAINASTFNVELAPGAGAVLKLGMKRYANQPKVR